MTKITLTKIGFFNPGRLTDQEIEMSFIARKELFENLLGNVIDNDEQSIPQHLLIIGQRGMGKTSLLVRLAVELKKEKYKDFFIPLVFPEEQYNIDKLSKFWLNSLDALADALDREDQNTLVDEIDVRISQLTKVESDKEQSTYKAFKEWCNKVGKRPVLLVDNLNLIFDKITVEEQHRLRGILMEKGAPIMVGASSNTMKDTSDYGAPFYDAFDIQYLTKLNLEESLLLLKNLGEITGKSEINQSLSTNRGRMTALHQLTGGTPRSLTMLFPLISGGFSQEIQDDLEALLDIITPLYKARFEELPPQMQVILDAIALNWDPVSLEELRNSTELTNAKLSPQLKRLVDVGWIQKLKSTKTKGGLYEISERFFNVWYLMRRSSRRQKRELYCLSKFLEVFYGEAVESIATKRLLLQQDNKNDLTLNLALAEAVKQPELRDQLKRKTYKKLIELGKYDNSIHDDFNIPKEYIKDSNANKVFELISWWVESRPESTVKLANHLIKNEGSDLKALGYLMSARCKTKLFDYQEAETDYLKALKSGINSNTIWKALGSLYMDNLYDYFKAEKVYLKYISNDKADKDIWIKLGDLYHYSLEKFREAEKAYLKTTQIDHFYPTVWFRLGDLYKDHLLDFKKAEKAYLKEIEINQNRSYIVIIYNKLGTIYQDQVKDYEKAKDYFAKALKIDEHNEDPPDNSNIEPFNRVEDARIFYNKQTSISSDQHIVLFNLTFLLVDKLNRFSEASQLIQQNQDNKGFEDSYSLIQMLLEYRRDNFGLAKTHLLDALQFIQGKIPDKSKIDWWRTGAIVSKMGYSQHFTEVLEESGYDIIMRPYYEAIKAYDEKDADLYLNTVAAEVREPAKQIFEWMKKYNDEI